MKIWKTVVGIESAEKDLRIAMVRVSLGRFRLQKCLRIEGFVEMSEVDKAQSLSKVIKAHRIPTAHVSLSLPRDNGIIRQIELPIEVLANLKSALTFQVESLSPWPMEELYWDFATYPAKRGDRTCRITVAMIPRAVLDPWIKLFQSAGLPLSGTHLSSLSSAHSVALLWKPVSPTVVIRCETGYLEGALVREQGVTSLTVATDQSGGGPWSLESLLAKLASLSQLPDLQNPRTIAYGAQADAIQNPTPASIPIEGLAQASTWGFGAITSALSELGRSGFKINLLPSALRYRRSQLQLLPTYVLILMAALLAVAIAARNGYQNRQYAARLDAEIRRLEPEVKQVLAQQAEMKSMQEKYGVLKSYAESRDLNLEAIREFARLMPADCWLLNYGYQDRTITVSGIGRSASEIQKLLEGSPLFKDVQFISTVTRDAAGKEHFTLRTKMEVLP